jgi:hypothetical protein
MPPVDPQLGNSEEDLQDRCKDLERRVTELDEKWRKFDLRVSTLMWLAGIAAALGVTATVLYEPLKNNVEAAIVDYTKLQTQITQVQLSMKQLPTPAASQTLPPKETEKKPAIKSDAQSVQNPPRALRQINAEIEVSQGAVTEPYYTHGYTQDIGQLYNCVNLFISDLRVQPRNFQESTRFYEGIQRIYEALLARAQKYITPANEPDTKNLTFHTSAWFQNFHKTLDEMESEHTHGKLSDDQLDRFQQEFQQHRDSLWGPAFSEWPSPLVK